MKRFLLAGLSVLLMAPLVAPTAHAQTRIDQELAAIQMPMHQPISTQLSPADLVTFAYRGQYKEDGIPGYGGFIEGYRARTIRAKDIAAAAVKHHQLPMEILQNQAYLNAVELQALAYNFD